jgi:hypothetical protein
MVEQKKKNGSITQKKAANCPDLTNTFDNISSKIKKRRRYYGHRST